MGHIILLAMGAAVFPLLLACVAILLARPHPRRLLLGFYLGALVTSVVCGLAVLRLFDRGHHVAGSTPSTPHPWVSIVVGILGLALARLLWTRRSARPRPPDAKPSAVTRRLDRASVPVAVAVGAVINLPGPFYLLALGDIAQGGYTPGQELGLILLFNIIMFILLEVPLIGYVVQPEETAVRVGQVSRWLNANGVGVVGAFVGLCSAGALAQGVAALVT